MNTNSHHDRDEHRDDHDGHGNRVVTDGGTEPEPGLSVGARVIDDRTHTRATVTGWPTDGHARVARDADGTEALIPIERLRPADDSEGGDAR